MDQNQAGIRFKINFKLNLSMFNKQRGSGRYFKFRNPFCIYSIEGNLPQSAIEMAALFALLIEHFRVPVILFFLQVFKYFFCN